MTYNEFEGEYGPDEAPYLWEGARKGSENDEDDEDKDNVDNDNEDDDEEAGSIASSIASSIDEEEAEAARYEEAIMVLEEASSNCEFESSERMYMFGEGPIGITFNSFSALFDSTSASTGSDVIGGAKQQQQHHSQQQEPPHDCPICVTEVALGSQAHDFGLKRCDLICALNGKRLPPYMTNDAFFDVLVDTPRPLALTFRRAVVAATVGSSQSTSTMVPSAAAAAAIAAAEGRQEGEKDSEKETEDEEKEERIALLERKCVEMEEWASAAVAEAVAEAVEACEERCRQRVSELEEKLQGARAMADLAFAVDMVDQHVVSMKKHSTASSSSSNSSTSNTDDQTTPSTAVEKEDDEDEDEEGRGKVKLAGLLKLKCLAVRSEKAVVGTAVRKWQKNATEDKFEEMLATERGLRMQVG
jgi:hypothetical protein